MRTAGTTDSRSPGGTAEPRGRRRTDPPGGGAASGPGSPDAAYGGGSASRGRGRSGGEQTSADWTGGRSQELPGSQTPPRPAVVLPANRLPLKILVQFTKQLAVLLRAGSGLVPALAAIQRQMRRPAHAALIGAIVVDLEDGLSLTAALRKHPRCFDAVYCAIVAAGEASGAMTQMLERLAQIVGKRRSMQRKIIGAMAYPVLLILMCLNIFAVLLFFVLPRFSGMFEQLGVETPSVTRALLALADWLEVYWSGLLAVVVATVIAVVWMATHDTGRQWASNAQLYIPILGGLRARLIQAQVFRTLGMLLESGVGVLEALDLVRESTRNRKFQALFTGVEEAVTSGGRLSTAFQESGLVEPSICQAIYTGEDSGNLGGIMTFCADVLDESNEELVTVIMRLIEPAILIGMGVVVGGVAIALFLPLFDLTSAVR